MSTPDFKNHRPYEVDFQFIWVWSGMVYSSRKDTTSLNLFLNIEVLQPLLIDQYGVTTPGASPIPAAS